MKKKIFSLLVALVATVAVQAQIISVVSPSGATSLYRTLPEAIKGAANGSVVYLPGGGFTIEDSVKITKKLTIIGVGHRANGDNVDGITTISGNLNFNQGSDGSAVMACYISGRVYIGRNGQVNDILVTRCNVGGVYLGYASTSLTYGHTGTVLSQNFFRGKVEMGYCGGTIKNNIFYNSNIEKMQTGIIQNNVLTDSGTGYFFDYVSGVTIIGNVFSSGSSIFNGSNNQNNSIYGNAWLGKGFGDDPVSISASQSDLFENPTTSSYQSYNFHFKEAFKQYESQVGIYAGEGFDDSQLAPVPHIIHKDIDDKTDASGKLRVRIRVKASE